MCSVYLECVESVGVCVCKMLTYTCLTCSSSNYYMAQPWVILWLEFYGVHSCSEHLLALVLQRSFWLLRLSLDFASLMKNLTLKLTMIIALITAQRAQTLTKLRLSEMSQEGRNIVFRIGEGLKTKAPGTAVVELKPFDEDKSICAVSLIHLYIRATEQLRSDDCLLRSFVQPHNRVHVDTIRRWITNVMFLSGIDTTAYKPHSTRAVPHPKPKRNKSH